MLVFFYLLFCIKYSRTSCRGELKIIQKKHICESQISPHTKLADPWDIRGHFCPLSFSTTFGHNNNNALLTMVFLFRIFYEHFFLIVIQKGFQSGKKHWEICFKPILKYQNYFCPPNSVCISGEHYSPYPYYIGRWL